jgi:hypothetical protein
MNIRYLQSHSDDISSQVVKERPHPRCAIDVAGGEHAGDARTCARKRKVSRGSLSLTLTHNIREGDCAACMFLTDACLIQIVVMITRKTATITPATLAPVDADAGSKNAGA